MIRVLVFACIILFILGFVTQITLPMLKGQPVLPLFRKSTEDSHQQRLTALQKEREQAQTEEEALRLQREIEEIRHRNLHARTQIDEVRYMSPEEELPPRSQ